jgi:SAM-dependent methyltransferase
MASKPELIATMLRLLDVQPDQRVLEIGTGSGYSTALLAVLVGAGGQVISLDIDPDMLTRTQRAARPGRPHQRHDRPRRRPSRPQLIHDERSHRVPASSTGVSPDNGRRRWPGRQHLHPSAA